MPEAAVMVTVSWAFCVSPPVEVYGTVKVAVPVVLPAVTV